MVKLCSEISNPINRDRIDVEKPAYLSVACLRHFLPIAFTYIRRSEDIDRSGGGPYSPTSRDNAQHFRDWLLDRLAQTSEPGALEALFELLEEPNLSSQQDWLLHLIDQRMAQDAEGNPWKATDVVEFAQEYETDPKCAMDLFKIAVRRFDEIKDLVECHDHSARDEMPKDADEEALQSWLCRKLNELSRGRYKAVWSPKVDMKKEPDLRLDRIDIGSVVIEVKWADTCSLVDLENALQDQLVGRYMRAPTSRHGLLVLGYKGKDHWKSADGDIDFMALLTHLKARATSLLGSRPELYGLNVIGISFAKPKLP